MSSSQHSPNVSGHVAPGWEELRTMFEENLTNGTDIGSSLCIYHQGKCVVRLAGGWKDPQTKKEPYTEDTLQCILSVSKGVTAAAVALCVEKGWLDYQAPIAKYWPEFGANGKQDILVCDLLAHRAGLAFPTQELTAEDVFDWNRITSVLAAQKPIWKPGSAHGYHAYTIGFLAGELIQRADPKRRSYSQFIHDELDSEFHIGIHDEKLEARIAPLLIKQLDKDNPTLSTMDSFTQKAMTCGGAIPLIVPETGDMSFNQLPLHQAVIPAVNGMTNAHALARIYALLIGNVVEDDRTTSCLLSKKTLESMTENITPMEEVDLTFFSLKNKYSRGGFELNGETFDVLGEDGFGHHGLGGSISFASASLQLAFAHVCNQLDFSTVITDPRNIKYVDAIKKILVQNKNS